MLYSNLKFIDDQTNAICHTQDYYSQLSNDGMTENNLMLFQLIAKENYTSCSGMKLDDYLVLAKEFTSVQLAKEALRRFLTDGIVKFYDKTYIAVLPDEYIYRETAKNAVIDSVKDYMDRDIQDKALREMVEAYLTLLFEKHIKVDPAKFHYELCKMLRDYGVAVVTESVTDAVLKSSIGLFEKSELLPDFTVEDETKDTPLYSIMHEKALLNEKLNACIADYEALKQHNSELVTLLTACEDNRRDSLANFLERNDDLTRSLQAERELRVEREKQITILNTEIDSLKEKVTTLRGRAKDATVKESETAERLRAAEQELVELKRGKGE